MSASEFAQPAARLALLRAERIQPEYAYSAECARNALAVVYFGAAPAPDAPFAIPVALHPLCGSPAYELWPAQGAVRVGASGSLRYAHDDRHLFGELQFEEGSDVRATAERMYALIQQFQSQCAFPHLLRMWNYLDAINDGEGDRERYREFCAGRAAGFGPVGERFPAASAIGRQQHTGSIQVFWLAGLEPGAPLENPRQIAAYRYPRIHGPVSPTFSRATLASNTLLISGTASIVGHASQHHESVLAQVDETLRNLQTLTDAEIAGERTDAVLTLKVYVREPADAPQILERLRSRYPHSKIICVAADICRRELLLEIEGVLG